MEKKRQMLWEFNERRNSAQRKAKLEADIQKQDRKERRDRLIALRKKDL
jgi:hypothetical protein